MPKVNGRNTTDILLEDLCRRTTGPLSLEEIADYTGVDHRHINRIEQKSLRKIREAVEEVLSQYSELRDIL